jgi:hypothetical protein
MNIKEMRYEDVDWIHLIQDRDQWQTCEMGSFFEQLSFSRHPAAWSWLILLHEQLVMGICTVILVLLRSKPMRNILNFFSTLVNNHVS